VQEENQEKEEKEGKQTLWYPVHYVIGSLTLLWKQFALLLTLAFASLARVYQERPTMSKPLTARAA